jgi:hypothetical protein
MFDDVGERPAQLEWFVSNRDLAGVDARVIEDVVERLMQLLGRRT